jgi:prepilin-type N-terminal cleavage/methylation domain-containing protein
MLTFQTPIFTKIRRNNFRAAELRASNGFTIVELMIATLVFSVLLVLITVGVIRFNQAYYKGVTQSNTQNVARTIVEDISQAIQFGTSGDSVAGTPGSTPGQSYYFCVGNLRYRYLLGDELSDNPGSSQTYHALVVDSPSTCNGADINPTSINVSSLSGSELVSPKMRLSKLSVQQVSGSSDLWSIDVRVAYGDDDLFFSPSGDPSGAAAPDATCSSGAGSQFCAVSELSTIVQKRVN